MSGSVQQHQAEAYEIFEFAQKISNSKDARADLAGIADKDATIFAMSKMMINMIEVAKAANLVSPHFPYITASLLEQGLLTILSSQTPAVVKRAHAIREAGRDKSMKRILPRAVDEVRTSIANDEYKRTERAQVEKINMGRSSKPVGGSNADKRAPGYWAGHLAGLDMSEEKDTDEHSDIEASWSKNGVMDETPEMEDLIEL
jgi:hypothetical protein